MFPARPRSVPFHPRRGGCLSTLFWFMVVGVAALGLAWVLFLPQVAAYAVGQRTGFALTSSQFSLNPFTGHLVIRDLRLSNPADFPTADFVDLRHVEADVEMSSLFSERLVVERVIVDLPSFTVVRTDAGLINAKLFADRLSGPPTPPPATPPPGETAAPTAAPAKAFLLRQVDVKLGRFRVENFQDGERTVREINLNVDQHYENITSPKQFLNAELLLQLAPLGDSLAGIIPSEWSQFWSKTSRKGTELLKSLGRKTSEVLRSAAETLEEKSKP